MHELSIALSIVDGASQEALNRGGAQVHAVHLKLGALSGVVKDALLFSYEVASNGTLLEGSRLVIEDVAGCDLLLRVPGRTEVGVDSAILLSGVRYSQFGGCAGKRIGICGYGNR